MEDSNQLLKDDIKKLGAMLGEVISEQEGSDVFDLVEQIRTLAKASLDGDNLAVNKLTNIIKNLPALKLTVIARSYAQFLNLANIAEQYHRLRRTNWYKINKASENQKGSLLSAFASFSDKGVAKDKLYAQVLNLDINLVLTAHPTEVTRRTLMHKYDYIARCLEENDTSFLSLADKATIDNKIKREITAIWQTDEIRRKKVTPIDEAKWCFAVIESTLMKSIPEYLQQLNQVVSKYCDKELPLDFSPIRFGSWMGGDRDGNPFVTAKITNQVLIMAKWVACDLYLKDLENLKHELSMNKASEELLNLVANSKEPYRAYLKQIRKKLFNLREQCEAKLDKTQSFNNNCETYKNSKELFLDLKLLYDSLCLNNGKIIADGNLLTLIRKVSVFGFNLAKLDLRQDAKVHFDCVTEIAKHFKVDYQELSEEDKVSFLLEKISSQAIVDTTRLDLSNESQELIATINLIKDHGAHNFYSYIISMCAKPSDLLSVIFLQKVIGIKEILQVVPLFETLDDLNNAKKCIQDFVANKTVKDLIKNDIEVMIGYSDSTKDAGIIAASYAQFCAIEELLEVGKNEGINISFFHGRGGSVGRGGAPTHMAILSQPSGAISGKIRVTQQGEVIRNRFAMPKIALRTLEIYTSAMLEGAINYPVVVKDSWREIMQNISQESTKYYRGYLSKEDFYDYFTQVTPINELKKMILGSRPARRTNSQDLKSLRAIPWIFSWTQNRMLTPAWLGVVNGLQSNNDIEAYRQMARDWPFFASLLNMIEMVLAKASPAIASHYENRLVTGNLLPLAEELRLQFAKTVKIIKQILQEEVLLEKNPVLRRTIDVRNPYILPLNLLQVEVLKNLRNLKETDDNYEKLLTTLLVTVGGIAAGMRNTG